jgi:crotonobetainyl-CoA:carnitine CoA-transferase CaiB-like acyl-CoA transferase
VSASWRGGPCRSGIPIADLAASSTAVIAVLSALRTRDRTGKGAYLDISIVDCALAYISVRSGPNFSNPPGLSQYASNDVFETADHQYMAITAVEDKYWDVLVQVLMPYNSTISDARFRSMSGRQMYGDEIHEKLTYTMRLRRAEEWVRSFAGKDISVEPVRTVKDAAFSPQVATRGIVQALDGESHVTFPAVRNGIPMATFRRTAPKVLRELTDFLSS